jgi:hypothetical protein
MEMLDESGEGLWEEEMECDAKECEVWMDFLEIHIMPTSQEFSEEAIPTEQKGYEILGMHTSEEEKREKGAETDEMVTDMKVDQKKNVGEGKRAKWGPVQADRSTRIQNDGRTSLEKAKDNKKKGDLEELYSKGNTRKTDKHVNSKHLHKIACTVGIDLGSTDQEVEGNLEVCSEFNISRANRNPNTAVGSVGCEHTNQYGEACAHHSCNGTEDEI